MPMKKPKTLTWRQQRNNQFMQLINRLKSNNEISGADWRAYRKQWENHPQGRKLLSETLQRRYSE